MFPTVDFAYPLYLNSYCNERSFKVPDRPLEINVSIENGETVYFLESAFALTQELPGPGLYISHLGISTTCLQ